MTRVFIAGQRRSLTPTIARELRRRSAIEAVIGHMKTDGWLERNYLKGALGDAINALLCGAGYNLRLILNHLARLLRAVLGVNRLPCLARFVVSDVQNVSRQIERPMPTADIEHSVAGLSNFAELGKVVLKVHALRQISYVLSETRAIVPSRQVQRKLHRSLGRPMDGRWWAEPHP